jgi:phosphoglycolate phosphatase
VIGLLDGVDLVVFDKDGTLIEFHAMWSGWATKLAADLEATTGVALRDDLYGMLGYDAASGRTLPRGPLAVAPMARLQDHTMDLLVDHGVEPAAAAAAMAVAWHAPDPVALAYPVTDLPALLLALRSSGRKVGVATSDDRGPTLRTLIALGIDELVDAVACADDTIAPKPAPDMILEVCRQTDVPPDRTAVIGDSTADIGMCRAAGAARCYGVLTGVGGLDDLGPVADDVLDSVAALTGA